MDIVGKYGFVILAFGLLLFSGCATAPKHYAAESLGLGYVKRVVVLPFENNTEIKFAGQRFSDVITTEILSRGLFEVVEKGETRRFLREELVQKEQETLDQVTAQRLGQELKQPFGAGPSEEGRRSLDRSGGHIEAASHTHAEGRVNLIPVLADPILLCR